MPATSDQKSSDELRIGYLYSIGAYFLWGFFPLYWHLLREVPPLEILCHRIIWSWLFYVLLLKSWRGQKKKKKIATINKNVRLRLMMAAVVVSSNWLCYIYAVTSGHVLESSLGYFITPFVLIFLRFLVLGERLSRSQWIAVALALVSAIYMVAQAEGATWISLALAVSFGSYGLIRKTVKVDPLVGSAFETMVLIVPATLCLMLFHVDSTRPLGFLSNDLQSLYLVLGGLVTGLPLWWFTEGATRIPLTTLGFLQYTSPTFQFLTAILFFHENFGKMQLVTFGLIWFAILIYVVDLAKRERRSRRSKASQKSAN